MEACDLVVSFVNPFSGVRSCTIPRRFVFVRLFTGLLDIPSERLRTDCLGVVCGAV